MTEYNELFEEKWYVYLKRKYNLSDDDMEEYIESFNIINRGNNITADNLRNFIDCEIQDYWSKYECEQIIININKQLIMAQKSNIIVTKNMDILDLKSYLFYIIPICNDFVTTSVGIRELFNSLDKNCDGKITCTELTSLLYNVNYDLSSEEIIFFTAEIKKICAIVDINHDGYICYDEFKKFIIKGGLSSKK